MARRILSLRKYYEYFNIVVKNLIKKIEGTFEIIYKMIIFKE